MWVQFLLRAILQVRRAVNKTLLTSRYRFDSCREERKRLESSRLRASPQESNAGALPSERMASEVARRWLGRGGGNRRVPRPIPVGDKCEIFGCLKNNHLLALASKWLFLCADKFVGLIVGFLWGFAFFRFPFYTILMDVEERELLRRNLAVAEENNKMLKSLHRAQTWSRVWKISYWLIIIALSIGAYYYIQPYVKFLQETIGAVGGQVGGFGDFLKGTQR